MVMIRNSTDIVPPPEELLRQAAWVRRLARGLVSGDADADDLAQDALLAAWRRPPAKTVGRNETCENCHRDIETYEVLAGARPRLDELLRLRDARSISSP